MSPSSSHNNLNDQLDYKFHYSFANVLTNKLVILTILFLQCKEMVTTLKCIIEFFKDKSFSIQAY